MCNMPAIIPNYTTYILPFNRTNMVPSTNVIIIYGCVVPFISGFGVVANFINGIVLMRPSMTPSAFTYLATISWLDCFSCAILCVSSVTQIVFYNSDFWTQCNIYLQNPILGSSTGSANLTLVLVTLDRLVYIKSGLPRTIPPFCTKRVARIVVVCILAVATVLNIPYYFIFEYRDGSFYTTQFFHSTYYMIYNWMAFFIFAIFPVVFLMVGSSIMISTIRRWVKGSRHKNNRDGSVDKKRHNYQIKLTATLVAVIFLFYIGDIPGHMTSPKSAISLLFAGDITRTESETMTTVRMIVSILNSFQLSVNIIVYTVINPTFMLELLNCVKKIMSFIKKIIGINLALQLMTKSKIQMIRNNINELKHNEAVTLDQNNEQRILSDRCCKDRGRI